MRRLVFLLLCFCCNFYFSSCLASAANPADNAISKNTAAIEKSLDTPKGNPDKIKLPQGYSLQHWLENIAPDRINKGEAKAVLDQAVQLRKKWGPHAELNRIIEQALAQNLANLSPIPSLKLREVEGLRSLVGDNVELLALVSNLKHCTGDFAGAAQDYSLLLANLAPNATGRATLINKLTAAQKSEPLECGAKNSVKEDAPIEMVDIPGGEFLMGSNKYASEKPIHKVTIKPFRFSSTKITRGLYAKFVKETGYPSGHCFSSKGAEWEERSDGGWNNPGFGQNADHPVVCISWQDTQVFIDWLNRSYHPRNLFRLPTEAEWEYAARAGSNTNYPWGDEFTTAAAKKINCAEVLCADGYAATSAVKSFPANSFGLFDMIGNAWEWTQNCWSDNYLNAAADGSEAKAEDCSSRVLRGGSWSSKSEAYLRSANRDSDEPGNRNSNTGFRLAQDITEE